ncbi:polyprenyl synthetase family protein [Parasutterella excrementihominis]|nr:polyprenyl synthetase family protein [Parasutterella excrementihominis]
MAEYALCLGRAFQIIDDVLDYTGSKDNIGKNLGTDLREGKMTMPLIYALRHCSEEDAKIIRTAVSSNDPDLESVTRVILASGAIDACIEAAKKEVSQGIDALNCLPTSAFKNSLIELLSLTVERDR